MSMGSVRVLFADNRNGYQTNAFITLFDVIYPIATLVLTIIIRPWGSDFRNEEIFLPVTTM